jgi:activator of 2-hydroxyglutaryl-CoA dehydratase
MTLLGNVINGKYIILNTEDSEQMAKKYYGGCDVGSTYTKCVILDENGKIAANTTIKSKINSERNPVYQTKSSTQWLD